MLTRTTLTAATTTYTYDADNQLRTDGVNTLTYDNAGNRTNGGSTPTTGNELTTDGLWTYTYDNAGNETYKVKAGGENWTYIYNNRNQLTEADHRSSIGGAVDLSAVYKYDAFGNRIEQDEDADGAGAGAAVVTKFVLDDWKNNNGHLVGNDNWDVLADLVSGSLTNRYIHGDATDQLFANLSYSGGTFTPYWYLTDIHGSVRTVVDNSGAVKETVNYDAFGNILAGTDANPQYRARYAWTGRELDVETGLQYNRARWYDPAAGRWIGQDPLGFDAGDSNLYRYVHNRPTVMTDPSGLDEVLPNPIQVWPPETSYNYLDPWVEKRQGESKDMVVATVNAAISNVNVEKSTYKLTVTISSAVPAQKVNNKLVEGGTLPAGVNLRTEFFLRSLEPGNRPIPGSSTLGITFDPAPLKGPQVDVNQKNWKLPVAQDLALPKNIVWAKLPSDAPITPTIATISAVFQMGCWSGKGSGSIVMNGLSTDAPGRKSPDLPMRPIYLEWSFNVSPKTGFIKVEQRGTPVIED